MSSPSSRLPSGWCLIQLGEIVEVLRGVSYKKQDASELPGAGLVPILRATNISRKLDFDELVYVPQRYVGKGQLLKANDIVLAASSGSRSVVGKAAPLESDWNGSFGAFCYALRPDPEVDPRLIALYLQTSEYRNRVGELSAGVNINNLKREHIASFQYPFPPLQEQHRIVAEIEKQFTRLDAAVAALKQAKVNLKRYRAAVLKAACEGRLVPTEAELARDVERSYEIGEQLLARSLNERRAKWEFGEIAKMKASGKVPKGDSWKKKYKEPVPPDMSNLPLLPEEWTWASLGQVSWSVKDGPHYSPKYTDEGVPFVTGGQVRPQGVDFASAKRISPELHAELKKRCNPERGDMLYTKGGTTGIARVNTYDFEFSVWVHVAVLKLVESIEAFYLQHALNSPFCYAQSQRFTHGVGNQDLGLTRMVRIAFGLPPLPEQRRIVAEVDRRLSDVDATEKDLNSQLVRADRLRQSILKRAFEGKLVPQHASDEPASALLERIKAARSVIKSKPSARLRARTTKETTMPEAGIPRPIVEVLREKKVPMSPEQLFKAAGYTVDTIDEFYVALKSDVEGGHILESRAAEDTILLHTSLVEN